MDYFRPATWAAAPDAGTRRPDAAQAASGEYAYSSDLWAVQATGPHLTRTPASPEHDRGVEPR
ncbi:hypothetical protein ACGFMM_11770 [Streptomyces sp. NPDC048604]|uniref:hypothetical protein n=1 Tax=Streptomyces sp. NPDC048604 TaxID=3365578 RepID=UPI0037102880